MQMLVTYTFEFHSLSLGVETVLYAQGFFLFCGPLSPSMEQILGDNVLDNQCHSYTVGFPYG